MPLTNVTSTNNAGAGLYLSGTGVLVSGGSYSDNGQIGIDGSFANGSTVKDATISGNNTANYDQGWDAGGLKVTNTANLTVEGNTVKNNNGNGIWADISSSNWTIEDNGVAGNNGNGIMYEISHNATISNNLVVNNQGSAIYISNSDGVTATGNGVVVPPGNAMTGAAIGGGVVIWDNSGRGNDPNTGQPYLSNSDSAENNTIVGPQSTSGIFSVLGTPSDDTFANNVFEAAGAAGTAAAQAAVAAAQAAYNAASQAAGAVEKSVGTALNALSAPQTSIPAADPQGLTPDESAPAQESTPTPTVPPQPAPAMVTASSAQTMASSQPTTAPTLNPGPLSVARVAALAAAAAPVRSAPVTAPPLDQSPMNVAQVAALAASGQLDPYPLPGTSPPPMAASVPSASYDPPAVAEQSAVSTPAAPAASPPPVLAQTTTAAPAMQLGGASQTIGPDQVYSQGAFTAFIAPFNAAGVNYSANMTLANGSLTSGVNMTWNYGSTPTSAGVYDFSAIDYGDYDNTTPSTPVPSSTINNIQTLTETHNLSLAGNLQGFDAIDDMFLTASPGNSSTNAAEVEVFLHTPTYSAQYVQSSTPIGTFQDGGITWTVAKSTSNSGSYPDYLIMPANQADVAIGTVDVKAMLNYLVSNGGVSGNLYFNGFALGTETQVGGGSMAVNSLSVDYTP